VDEARQAALEELVPKALKVLRAHLGEGDEVNPAAWRAALRVFEHAYGRVPERVEPEDDWIPQTPDDVSRLSTKQLAALLGRTIPPSLADE
jgi:hypothetical protein